MTDAWADVDELICPNCGLHPGDHRYTEWEDRHGREHGGLECMPNDLRTSSDANAVKHWRDTGCSELSPIKEDGIQWCECCGEDLPTEREERS